ncbi:MAG: hypothetical protein R3E66_23455 [bacterium]
MKTAMLVIAVIASVFFAERRHTNRRKKLFVDAAKPLGLSGSETSVSGFLDGVEVLVWAESRRSGKVSVEVPAIKVGVLGLPAGLSVRSEGIYEKITKVTSGAIDIQLGVPDIDPKIMIVGKDEEEVRRWGCNPAVADALRELIARPKSSFRIHGGDLVVYAPHAFENADVLSDLIREVVAKAKTLSRSNVSAGTNPSKTSRADGIW